MHRRDFLVTLGVAGGVAAWGVNALAQATSPPRRGTGGESGDASQQAVQNLATALTESAAFIRQHPFYTDDLNRAAGMAFLSRMLLWSLQYKLNQDPDYPFFRVLDFNTRVGGDNPDQRYLMSPIRGGERYRIWGAKGSVRRLDLQVYAGTPWKKGAGRSASALAMEDIQFNADGSFELAEDEALVVTMWPSPANYQGIQLMDDWMSSLEYANRQTSLTRDQAYLSKDGAYHFVVAPRDPGVPNWLDTMGLRQGGIIIRYDGMREQTIPSNRMPVARKIKLARLRRVLPKDTPTVTSAQREATIKERRRHVQRRFGV